MGSGMVLDREGRILTNYHVVADVDEIKVQLADHRTLDAEIVSTDPPSDIAVIRIKGPVPKDLVPVELGDSSTVEVGHLVLAIGAPFGYAQTVTTGVVSATGRMGLGINTYEDFLQTDAAINPGNSGGPLVNMRGEVIGVNSVIASSVGQFSGVGFSIPVNMVKTLLPTLVKGGKITRGMLGVTIQDVTDDLAPQFALKGTSGALVSSIAPGSPAGKAGMQPGDVITRYDGQPIEDTAHLRNRVASTAPGKTIELTVVRGGKEQDVRATIGKLPEEQVAESAEPPGESDARTSVDGLGIAAQSLTPELAAQLGYRNESGAVITGVRQGSPAAIAGLQQGDLVVEAAHKPVNSVDDLRRALERSRGSDSLLLRVRRDDGAAYVVVAMK
jgi:serine protease Do